MGAADSKHRARPNRHPSRIADRPSPPGKPQLVPSDQHSAEPDVVTIRWEPPLYDGGSRITGYLVEHRRTGSPHWVRSAPSLVRVPELTLSGLEPGWRYQFRVSAQNTAGLSEPGELSDLLTVTLQRTAASAPHFVKELRNTVALENEKAELSVQVRGTPTPTIAWFKDGTEIFSSRSYRIVTDNETSTLIIHQAALTDEGEIKCSATNRVGYAVTRAKLTLEAPPSIRLPRQYEEGLLFEKDEVIRLKVSVAGRPIPEVTWLLNGEPVPGGGRYEASHSERYATLRVGEARREDRGEYQVRATNRLGEDVASFLVTVADRPMPPGRAKVVMTLGRSVTLSWTTPEDDGGCKIGNYIVEYYRLGWNMWLKAATCRQLTTTLGELIEGSEYKFRVKAENPYGVSDPSSESDVVFIPDPKRGLLEPPEHGSAENETAMDVWLEEKKRPISPGLTIDEQYGERKTKRKRGPMAPPQTTPDLGQVDKHSIVSEDSMSPPATPENFQPVIPKRRGKGEKIEVKKEILKDKESVRDQKEKRKMEELKRFDEIKKAEQMRRIEELKRSEELRKPEEPKTPEDSKQNVANIQSELKVKKETQAPQKAPRKEPRTITNEPPKVLKDLNSSHKDTQLPQKDPQKSHTPRVEHDPLHGSSELMLVLLPHSRATTEERETSKRELFESSMAIEGDDIAPPMSLSAPELGNGDPPELPPVRSAFSSTELLHERAMARFYQDMAREEAESSLQRKNSLQRRRSFERRSPPRPKDVPDTAGSLQDIPTSVKTFENTAKRKDTLSPATPSKPSVPELLETSTSQRGYSDKKTFSRDSMDSMLSVEDPHRKSMLVQQASEEDMEYEDSSFDEDEEDYNEEEEEHITDEIVDEEVEEELEEEEEEDEEEFSYDEKRGSLYTSESEEESRYSYSMEEDTYHPSAINKKYNEDTLISAYEGRGPLILGSGSIVSQSVQSTPFQIPTSRSEIKLKPILKQPTADNKFPIKSNETSEYDQSLKVDNEIPKIRTSPEKRFEPNFSAVMPKPILKVRENSQEPNSPLVQRRGAPIAGVEQEINLEPNKTNLDEGSDYETGTKKKQVRIEEPEDVTARESPVIEKVGVPEEFLPTNKTQVSTDEPVRERTGSLGDEGDATMVLVSHYSDIVAEYGRGRRPPKKLYLNYEALKAAAEEEEESAPDVPEVVVNEPEPEPKYEPEPEPEPEPPAPMTEVEQALEEIKTENYLEAYVEDRSEIKLEPVSDTPKKKSPLPAKKRSASPRKPKPPPIPPSVVQDSPPEKIDYIRTPSPELPPRLYTSTEKKVHSYFDFLMDISLFILACWLYIFKDERLSIPVLCLMIYRQANEAFQRKMEALRNKMPRRIRFWRRDE